MNLPLHLTGLVKKYGGLKAVDGVSFDIRPGEIFGLLGPNGAGKTSIISCIASLEKVNEGLIQVFGHDVTLEARSAKKQLGLVPQELINHGYFSAEEILRFHSGYYGFFNNQDRIVYLMKRLALWEHRKKVVRQLSGGMKRRLSVAKALVHRPKLLLLDEPTAGVDIELRASLWEFVRELREEGVSVLLTTHYLEEAEMLCDRVGILDQGKLQMVGETSHLIRKLTQRKVKFHVEEVPMEFSHPQLIHREKNLMVFQIPSTMPIGELIADLSMDLSRIRDLQIEEGSLEDAFRNILKGQE